MARHRSERGGDGWLDRVTRRGWRPIRPGRTRRRDRLPGRVPATMGWMPPEGPEDLGGSAGVREPRRPLNSPPALHAEADLPV